MRYMITIVLLCLCAGLAACDKGAKDAKSTTTSVPQVQPTGAATGGAAAAAPEPGSKALPAVGELPQGWPAELPPYAGSTITKSFSAPSPEGNVNVMSMQLEAQASMPDLIYYYFDKAQAAGMEMSNCAVGPDDAAASFSGPQLMLTLNGQRKDQGLVAVSLELRSGAPAPTLPRTVLWHDVDRLPPQFPEAVLARYPQAKLKLSGVNPDGSFVMEQQASATLAAVSDFYTKQFTAQGFKVGATMKNANELMLTFNSDKQQLTLAATLTDKLVKISLMLRSNTPPAMPGQIK